MKTHTRLVVVTLCGLVAVTVTLLLLATPTTVGEPLTTLPVSAHEIESPADLPPVVFLHDPAWPSYAQTEITIFPEPPVVGQPAEICVWVVNTSAVTQTVAVDLAFANFGIGLPFTRIGSRTIDVPPAGRVKVCLNWIPPDAGHWCLQAVLHVPGFPDQISQRNIDIWETLLPGAPAVTVFPVGNPLTEAVPIHLELKPNPNRQDWGMSLSPTDFDLPSGGQMQVTLVVTPPLGAKSGYTRSHRGRRSNGVDRARTAVDRRLPQDGLAASAVASDARPALRRKRDHDRALSAVGR